MGREDVLAWVESPLALTELALLDLQLVQSSLVSLVCHHLRGHQTANATFLFRHLRGQIGFSTAKFLVADL